jgi:phospholipid-binding lipoprotein MlaA
MRFQTAVALLALPAALAGCVSNPKNPEDPYENFNRQMYAFNDGLDKAVLEPVAKGYRAVTNEPVRAGVRNFFDNLGEPVTFANEVLQGKVGNAFGTVGRFAINTTIGILGIFNPAEAMGIQRTDEDFGQTLAVWGIGSGPYLVMPVLGSTNGRDLIGFAGDLYINPINQAEFDNDDAWRVGLATTDVISARELGIETIDDIRTTQVDPYTTLRRYYVRSRATAIEGSDPIPRNIEKVPDYELDF